MKRILLLTLIGLLSTALYAKKLPGIVIYDNDTIEGTFKVPVKFFSQRPDFEGLQYRVKFFDKAGQKIILKPAQVKEIRFTYRGEEIRMLSRENTLGAWNIFGGTNKIFLKLESDGYLKLFTHYYTQNTGGGYNPATGAAASSNVQIIEYVFQKGDEELKVPSGFTFRKDMTEYFADCPDIQKKIQDKELRRRDMEEIAAYYNAYCN